MAEQQPPEQFQFQQEQFQPFQLQPLMVPQIGLPNMEEPKLFAPAFQAPVAPALQPANFVFYPSTTTDSEVDQSESQQNLFGGFSTNTITEDVRTRDATLSSKKAQPNAWCKCFK